jgi:hypothetical protein
LAALDDSVGQQGTAVLLKAIVAIGDVGKVRGEAELFVVGGVIAKAEFVQRGAFFRLIEEVTSFC